MNQSIIQTILENHWDEIPVSLKIHYANKPFSQDITIANGHMNIYCKRWLSTLLRRLSALPAITISDIPVTVCYTSDPNSPAFHLHRRFYLPQRTPHQFNTTMTPYHNNEILEELGHGLCWRIRYGWRDNKITLTHCGYVFKLGSWLCPMPCTWLLGTPYAEEYAIDDTRFGMHAYIKHMIFGYIFTYNGIFTITEHP
jgi:hypothetical protein